MQLSYNKTSPTGWRRAGLPEAEDPGRDPQGREVIRRDETAWASGRYGHSAGPLPLEAMSISAPPDRNYTLRTAQWAPARRNKSARSFVPLNGKRRA